MAVQVPRKVAMALDVPSWILSKMLAGCTILDYSKSDWLYSARPKRLSMLIWHSISLCSPALFHSGERMSHGVGLGLCGVWGFVGDSSPPPMKGFFSRQHRAGMVMVFSWWWSAHPVQIGAVREEGCCVFSVVQWLLICSLCDLLLES